MPFNYNFPEVRTEDNGGYALDVLAQIEKAASELEEVRQAVLDMETFDLKMEAMDALHAAETLVRIVYKGEPDHMADLYSKAVIHKNAQRGYYGDRFTSPLDGKTYEKRTVLESYVPVEDEEACND